MCGYLDALGVEHGFALVGSKTTPIAFPGPYQTEADDINNRGEVVGNIFTGPSIFNPTYNEVFVYIHGVYSTLSVPGSQMTIAFGLNDYGVVPGYYMDMQGNFHGFVAVPSF